MTLKQKTKSALAEFSARGGGPHYLQIDDGPRRLSCKLASVDKLACEFQHLTLHTSTLADASTEQLQELAAKLAGRLTYLLEPIHPIETDAEGCVVIVSCVAELAVTVTVCVDVAGFVPIFAPIVVAVRQSRR